MFILRIPIHVGIKNIVLREGASELKTNINLSVIAVVVVVVRCKTLKPFFIHMSACANAQVIK